MNLPISTSNALEPLGVPDADVRYAAHVDLGERQDSILAHLIETIPWRSESITLWGKSYVQPRLIAWYGDEGSRYTYSGLALTPLPWTPTLLRIKERVAALCAAPF